MSRLAIRFSFAEQGRKALFLLGIMSIFVAIASVQVSAQDGLESISIKTPAGPVTWTIELAQTPEQNARGLMFREHMALDRGMLFRFEQTRMVEMWMKNTFIPLDMIFFNKSGQITHIHRDAVPHSLDIISSKVPAHFVLEINAGQALAKQLQAGQQASHPWFSQE